MKLCVIRYFWRSCLYVESYLEKLYLMCGGGVSGRRSSTVYMEKLFLYLEKLLYVEKSLLCVEKVYLCGEDTCDTSAWTCSRRYVICDTSCVGKLYVKSEKQSVYLEIVYLGGEDMCDRLCVGML